MCGSFVRQGKDRWKIFSHFILPISVFCLLMYISAELSTSDLGNQRGSKNPTNQCLEFKWADGLK